MKTTLFVALLVSIQIANAHPAVHYDRGWRPMSNEEAYRQFRVNMQRTHATWGPVDPTTDKDVMALKDDAVKVVQPVQVLGGFHGRNFEDSEEDRESTQGCEGDIECFNDLKNQTNIQSAATAVNGPDSTTIRYVRIAKKISETSFKNLIQSSKAEATNSYEVSENVSDTEDSLDTDQNIVLSQKSGYIYNPPKRPNLGSNKNYTQQFQEILSKYIDNSMNDKNYAISREPKKVNFFNPEFIYLPVPLKYFHRYNSNNNVSVNPTLAVLLSNYGYYLPGSFGVQNRYRNLYGYLAANNIHNNKPFGMYKVFSDTDSSN